MKTPDIYVDFAHGLTHGIHSANNTHLTPEAVVVLKDLVENMKEFSDVNPELLLIREIHLRAHDFEVVNYSDFEYGFWLGIYNHHRRNQAAK